MDERIFKHAEILVDHSTKVKPGDMVLIRYTDYGLPLAKAVYALAAKRGASPMICQEPTDAAKSFLVQTPEEYLSTLPVHQLSVFATSDVIIGIRGEEDLRAMKDVDKKRITLKSRGTKPITEVYMRKRWVTTQADSPAYAKEAGMSRHEYRDFIFDAMLRDWREDEGKLRMLERAMDETDEVKITGKDTDLTLSIKGKKAVADLGEHNVPWGEVFTAPVENSADGHIYFDLPMIKFGDVAKDISLKFSNGELVDYKAKKGGDLLKAIIETDEGSHRLGELGVGANDNITKFTKNILFDEKMGGTIHLALGVAFPDNRGKNQSAIHCDMIKTMSSGEMLFDNKVVLSYGKLLLPPEERQGGYGQV
jgi:aminopeptidase